MPAEPVTSELPEYLRRYFWDYDAGGPTGEGAHQTVVTRLLQAGGWDAVRWLRASVGDDGLRAFLTRRRGRGISPQRLRFWGLVLDLPREEVDAWIAAGRTDPWHARTRR